MGQVLNKFKNKKFRSLVFLYLIIFLIIIFLLNWLIKSSQAVRNKSQEENFSVYYKELLGRCDKDEKNYDCCFNSIAYMAANNLKLVGAGCGPGFKLNTFDCQGAYKWCEMIR